MTLEEKQLLLKDLCARLPHGVKIWIKWDKNPSPLTTSILGNYWHTVGDDIKPYLRPMSSMTEREKDEFQYIAGGKILETQVVRSYLGLPYKLIGDIENWLNAHHFDYRGLIPMGLALEAPIDVYKTE